MPYKHSETVYQALPLHPDKMPTFMPPSNHENIWRTQTKIFFFFDASPDHEQTESLSFRGNCSCEFVCADDLRSNYPITELKLD